MSNQTGPLRPGRPPKNGIAMSGAMRQQQHKRAKESGMTTLISMMLGACEDSPFALERARDTFGRLPGSMCAEMLVAIGGLDSDQRAAVLQAFGICQVSKVGRVGRLGALVSVSLGRPQSLV